MRPDTSHPVELRAFSEALEPDVEPSVEQGDLPVPHLAPLRLAAS